MPSCFISYVRENSDLIDRLVNDLEGFGITVWLDREDIKPGRRWKYSIREAISRGDYFIACFSKEYLQRKTTFMNEELTLAIEELRKRPTDRSWFIPIILSGSGVPDRDIGGGETLRDLQYVMLFEDWEKGVKKITSLIKEQQNAERTCIKVLLADDALIYREGLRNIIDSSEDIQVIGEAITPQDVLVQVNELEPDVLIIDLKWFGDEDAGKEVITNVKKINSSIKVIALTAFESLIKEARFAGADLALTRNFTTRDLLSIIRGLILGPI